MKTSFSTFRIAKSLALTLCVALPLSAQHSSLFRACKQKAKTQMEINACASEEALRAENERERLYAQLLARSSSQPGSGEKIKTTEKSWIIYRDAYLNAMYPAADKQAEYGSIYPMEADLLRARITAQHLVELRALLQQYNDEKH